MEYMLFVTITT